MSSYTTRPEQWPHYPTTYDALLHETARWGDRLVRAEEHYAQLDGGLPPTVQRVDIAVVDGYELPETFVLPRLCAEQRVEQGSFGLLLLVNFEGRRPPSQTRELLAAIRAQRQQSLVPTAIAVKGYEERKIDRLRSDAWDILAVHALRRHIEHPVVGISNDADTAGMPADYVPKMSVNEYVGQPATFWRTPVVFDEPGGAGLPMYRMLRYFNVGRKLFDTFLHRPVVYAGSMALTLATYATAGSWMRPQEDVGQFGASEPSKLIVNAWERLIGKTATLDDATAAIQHCGRTVDSHIAVSPRREVYAFSRHLGDVDSMAAAFTTAADTPFRRLSRADIARLAASVSADDPRFAAHLRELDNLWLSYMPDQHVQEAQTVLRRARSELGLPPMADVV